VVQPARGIAVHPPIDHPVLVHMEVERVVGLQGVMGVALQRFVPRDDLAQVLHHQFTFGQITQCKHPFAVHP